jgi:hypothetical protein
MEKVVKLMIIVFSFAAIPVFSQDVEGVFVSPEKHQTPEQVVQDKQACFAYANDKVDAWKHRTAKETGIGAVGGAVIGKIFGKPGVGAVAGGAAGGIHGHKKAKDADNMIRQEYGACLREKGYAVEENDGNI